MLFASDLDNTLIHSYKNSKIGDVCVEMKDGRELSFMSSDNYNLLKYIVKQCEFVPITTRSLEQYQRINLGVVPKYAIVAHGAILLIDGKIDEQWVLETRKLISKKLPEIHENDILYDVRYVDDFFIFGKSNDVFKAVKYLQTFIDNKDFIACSVQNKFYVMPKQLKKGTAMERLKNRINEKFVICAGDSFLDISMLEIADIAISPKNIELKNKNHQILCEECFSTEMLRIAAKSIEECKIKAKLDIP